MWRWLLLLLPLAAFAVETTPFWEQVREGIEGYTTSKSPEADELIQASGEVWRRWRNLYLRPFGVAFLTSILLVLLSFRLFHGPVRLKRRRGIEILRWRRWERWLHWGVASLFLLLALTGLSLLYGTQLAGLVGKELYAPYARIAKWCHNLAGPLFVVLLAIMIGAWLRDNLPERADLDWLSKLGGLLGEPKAGRFNLGEKLWFWSLFLFGGIVSLSGLLLDFPISGFGREVMQLALLLHAISAIVLVAFSFGHIFMGLVTEGALRGMVTGQVDLGWMEQHHPLALKRQVRPERTPAVERPENFFRPER